MKHQRCRVSMLVALAAAGARAEPDAAIQQVEIVATSPLPGQGIDRDLLPYMTQVLRRTAIDAALADNTSDLLARHAAGVQVSDIQGSPYQGDLSFRGYRASGLLGAPQGLSVYLDGVRINEPFGDVVNWDLVPEFALDSVALVPGANPAFGLNTLGGAISLTTLDGRHAPGTQAESSAGRFGRRRVNLSHGGADGDWDHYVGLGLFAEDGWRDHSAGRLGSLLGKLGVQTDAGRFGLNALAARSHLVGNGLVPWASLDEHGGRTPDLGALDRSAVYTHPDQTDQRLAQLSLNWRLALTGDAMLDALAYARQSRRDGVNGDLADEISAAPASLNRTHTRQQGHGAAGAWSSRQGAHQWQAGASVDQGHVRYRQTEQAATLDAGRGVQPVDDSDATLSAAVQGHSLAWGVHASDTWRMAQATHLTATLRYNEAQLTHTLSQADDDTGLPTDQPEEHFRYRSWNPALGIAQRLTPNATLFANAARNTRVPTVIELGCADPDHACRLPAGLQSDPYLKPVRSTTLEAGFRWGRDGESSDGGGSFTLYRTDNRDDIVFASVSVNGQLGYFRNVAHTRHQGLDAEWHGRRGAWAWATAYSHLDASYQFSGTLREGERNVRITPGTSVAGTARHTLKLSLDWRGAPALDLGGDLQAVSRRVSAGNEDGRLADAGDAARGDAAVPGYALLNLRARWRPATGWEWFASLDNVFDRRYASYGALATTRFDAQGRYTGEERDALFMAPGAPRSVTIGFRLGG